MSNYSNGLSSNDYYEDLDREFENEKEENRRRREQEEQRLREETDKRKKEDEAYWSGVNRDIASDEERALGRSESSANQAQSYEQPVYEEYLAAKKDLDEWDGSHGDFISEYRDTERAALNSELYKAEAAALRDMIGSGAAMTGSYFSGGRSLATTEALNKLAGDAIGKLWDRRAASNTAFRSGLEARAARSQSAAKDMADIESEQANRDASIAGSAGERRSTAATGQATATSNSRNAEDEKRNAAYERYESAAEKARDRRAEGRKTGYANETAADAKAGK